jgi:hypothetical protein
MQKGLVWNPCCKLLTYNICKNNYEKIKTLMKKKLIAKKLLAMPDCNSEKHMIATTICTQLQKKAMKQRIGKNGCLT